MFCPKCGAQNQDDAVFCTSCGMPLYSNQEAFNAAQQPMHQPVQPMQSMPQPMSQPFSQPMPQPSMKWYKFLIYFLLFFAALLNALSGILYLSGSLYGDDAELVYAFYEDIGYNLKTYDTIMGIICIIVAVFDIFTRFRLAAYKKDGPICLYATYIINAVVTTLYVMLVSSMLSSANTSVDMSQATSTSVTSIIISLAMVCINTAYFKKRKALFVK